MHKSSFVTPSADVETANLEQPDMEALKLPERSVQRCFVFDTHDQATAPGRSRKLLAGIEHVGHQRAGRTGDEQLIPGGHRSPVMTVGT